MNIPEALRAGDTWSWTDSLADYPAPTWTLKYVLYRYGYAAVSITATASGTDHAVTVSKTTTASIVAGEWNWSAYVEDATTRTTVNSGTVTVKPDLSVAAATSDLRSHAQIMLDGIEATLQGRATHADLSLTVNGRSIQYLRPKELLEWRNLYRDEVRREQQEEKIAAGGDSGRIVRLQFGSE